MILVFLYGPPAVGKLTVAKKLADLTGFKLFHNHLTVDLVTSLFDFTHESAQKLSSEFRLEMLEEAAKANLNVIFTYVYAKNLDDDFVEKVIKIIEKNKGKVLFVQLYCEQKELEKRVLHKSRKKFSKIKSLEIFKEVTRKHDLFSPILKQESLKIDNTFLSAKKTAQKIIEHYSHLQGRSSDFLP